MQNLNQQQVTLLAWLDAMSALYPAGLPEPCKKEPKIMFVRKDAGRGSSEEHELLMAAINKGLKLNSAQYQIMGFGEYMTGIEKQELHASDFTTVVFLGQAPSQEVLQRMQSDGISVVVTLDLGEVVANPNMKRELWNDLIKLIDTQ
ncbi:MAG: hypothetical protein DCC75_09045 [Proteobacteria bacterium]|nr:MAG: hypothetical protein DCC75_09045 [Pseudomonadota bacterium]